MRREWMWGALLVGAIVAATAVQAQQARPQAPAEPAAPVVGEPDGTASDDGMAWLDDDGAPGDDAPGMAADEAAFTRQRFGAGGGGGGMGPGAGGRPGMRGMGGMRRGAMRAMLLRKLDLSEAQRTRLADIRDRQQRRAIQARADVALARLDLRHALRDDHADASQIDTQIDRIARLRAELAKSRVASMLEARDVLTAEQRDELKNLRMHRGAGDKSAQPGDDHGRDERPGRYRPNHDRTDRDGTDRDESK